VGFASDLIQVATQSYHDQDYDLAIRYGGSALEARPTMSTLGATWRRLSSGESATGGEGHIDALVRLGELKEAFYVRGFAHAASGSTPTRSRPYEKSLAHGRRGVAIHRELASSYFELGDLPNAELHIRQAEERSSHNPYVVDLRCTIALRLGDLETAGRALAILERVDPSGFADHRRSTFEQARGAPEAALEFGRIRQ